MRKRERAVLILVLAALLLTGCGGPAPDNIPLLAAAASQEERSPSIMTFQAVDVKNEAVPPAQEEVLAAYDRAVTVFGWFQLNTLPCGSTSAMVGTNLYQRVDYPGISTMEQLMTYLRSLFSQAVIDRLLPPDAETPQYRDIDGTLFVLPSRHQPDPSKGATEVTVEQTGADACMVNVTVELLADDGETVSGTEYDSFPYQCVNGRWVFTSFKLVNEP